MARKLHQKILRPVHPNVGLQVMYRRKIDRLVAEMSRSYEHWLRAQYRETPPVMAQDATPTQDTKSETATKDDPKDLDKVTVVGIRASLMRAQDMKRDADTHIDAISAVDISALPDVSVLEALQRIAGISIERFAAKEDPDHFSTEGSGVTLRGLPNTRSEFNGRDTFSANSGRGLSFRTFRQN